MKPARTRPGTARPLAARAVIVVVVTTAAGACAVRSLDPPPSDPPAPTPAPTAAVPLSVPSVDGPLELRVSYPRPGEAIATRDRNFIFGSAGNGDARVWVGDTEVEVRDNGAFLAFLPVPPDGVYRLRATLDGREERLEVEVPLPPSPPEEDAALVRESAYPSGAWVALPGERIEAGFRGSPGGSAALVFADGARVPLVEGTDDPGGATDFVVIGEVGDPSPRGTDRLVPYRGFFTARPIFSPDTTVGWPALATEPRTAPREGTGGAHIEFVLAGRALRRPLPLNLVVMDPTRPRVGETNDPRPPERNGDGRVVARPGPGGGPYHYDWLNGTELELTGERDGAYRVRLTDQLSAWTPGFDVALHPPGAPPPEARVTTVRLDPEPGWVDVHVALDRRLPYRVDEGERSLTLRVYGAVSRVNFLQHGRLDPYVERAEWSQPSDRLFRLDLHLSVPPWGYETLRGEGDDLVLRIKRPPAADASDPLRGLTVGVDPGHGGADRETMGPTGLTEADANLGIALALRDELEARGARVVLTRATDTTVSLVERTTLARAADVDVWISVHNNALPDGIDPGPNNGTSVYYNHPRAAGLARAVQRRLLAELGLRDLGVGRADLHQARFAWAPAILSENAFLMIPEQEALLRSDEGRRRIARAHVRGLVDWLRERGTPGAP